MPRCLNPRCQMDYPAGSLQCSNPFCLCLLPEAVVAGRYRIETLIGIGGMGAVYRVSDTFEMQQVALKVLSLNNNTTDVVTAVERFRREARYAHQLRHRNIVPVLNFGQDGQLLYLVMPLITGGTLKSLLKAETPLPTAQIQAFLKDLASAIDEIHAHPQQVIHRDIKPSNLLIHQDDSRLVVTDFGIARAMQNEKPLTQRGWSLGTEHYIAPEQEYGQAQPASDIYAMGVVAYQMLTGLLPFQAVIRNQAAELPPPSRLNPTLPKAVDMVIERAMDIDPEKRFPSARAFSEALNDALVGEDIWSAPTIATSMVATNSANILVRTIIPENPCSKCGGENRPTSHFCRHCGHSLDETSPMVNDACQVGYISDEGEKARDNEDVLLVVQGLCVTLLPPRPFSLFAVADGLRGHHGDAAGGLDASRLAIETLTDILLPHLVTLSRSNTRTGSPPSPQPIPIQPTPTNPPDTIIEQWLHEGVRQANKVIYHCNADYDIQMASTLTSGLLYKHRLYIGNVGDSRAYHYTRDAGLRCISTNAPGQKGAADNRYLGEHYNVPIELAYHDMQPGDLILLCTNGLWHMVDDQRIEELLARGGDTQMMAHMLLEAANRAGGEGNISAIVIRVQ